MRIWPPSIYFYFNKVNLDLAYATFRGEWYQGVSSSWDHPRSRICGFDHFRYISILFSNRISNLWSLFSVRVNLDLAYATFSLNWLVRTVLLHNFSKQTIWKWLSIWNRKWDHPRSRICGFDHSRYISILFSNRISNLWSLFSERPVLNLTHSIA